MTGIYTIADRCIRVCSLYQSVHTLCRAYRSEGVPEMEVTTDRTDIEYERVKSARRDAAENRKAYPFSDEVLETLAVCRKIAEKMPLDDTFLFHASAVAVDGQAYLFTAPSGTGKSTHARLWRDMLGERAVMVNDDKPFLSIRRDGTAAVYGSPWDGKHRLSSNTSAPVRAICLLERSEENRIREITKSEAMPVMLQQTYRPLDPTALAKTLSLIERMKVRFFRLGCNMDPEAARLSYNTMKEE